jgi:hypothetical protein
MRPQIARLPERSVALRARVVSALLVHSAHMRPQTARLPERSVALRARVVSALLVHSAHMRPQSARRPERSVALRARVVSALLVYRAHMPAQIARLPERSVALRARVVSALLVHHAHMRPQMARLPERSVALRARVSARLSKLFHHPVVLWLASGGPLNLSRATRESTVAEMDRIPNVRVGWTFGLHRCICKAQALRFSYCSLPSTMFEISTGGSNLPLRLSAFVASAALPNFVGVRRLCCAPSIGMDGHDQTAEARVLRTRAQLSDYKLVIKRPRKAVYRAASRETRRTKTPSSPPSAKYPHKYSAHSTRSATFRTARMSDRVV